MKEPRTKVHDLALSAALQHLQQWNERGIMVQVHEEHIGLLQLASTNKLQLIQHIFSNSLGSVLHMQAVEEVTTIKAYVIPYLAA